MSKSRITELPKREYLQQAHEYQEDTNVSGFYASEKLDGQRAWWDGGISRGVKCKYIPYASKVIVKSGKPKPQLNTAATGLWSRYGNIIYAPDYFLNQLPSCMLDGELWLGRGNFQEVSKVVRKKKPDERWEKVEYKIFGSPHPSKMFQTGHCRDSKNIDLVINEDEMIEWLSNLNRVNENFVLTDWKYVSGNFIHELSFLNETLSSLPDGPASLHQQVKLSDDPVVASRNVDEMMEKAVSGGAEGIIVRDPHQQWIPKRVHCVLKVKPCKDDESRIVGFLTGEKTDRGSKLLGKIGSIIVEWNDKVFKIAGLTDDEREFFSGSMTEWAKNNPRTECPVDFRGSCFKLGEQISFKYMELTKDGIPRSPRYFRKREEE